MISLLIGSVIIDIEYIPLFFRNLAGKRLGRAIAATPIGINHSLLGSLLVSVPLGVFIRYMVPVQGYNYLISLIAGISMHLLADIPSHKNLLIFWPMNFDNNPLRFSSQKNYLYGTSILSLALMLAVKLPSILGLAVALELIGIHLIPEK